MSCRVVKPICESGHYPTAKRGDVVKGRAVETQEQLDAHLVWWSCPFCDCKVLIDAWRQTRERCICGAARCHHTDSRRGIYEEGWRRGIREWWMC